MCIGLSLAHKIFTLLFLGLRQPSYRAFGALVAQNPEKSKKQSPGALWSQGSENREALHGVGADRVGVTFPIFAVDLQSFALVLLENLLYHPSEISRIREKRRKMEKEKKIEEKTKEPPKKKPRKNKVESEIVCASGPTSGGPTSGATGGLPRAPTRALTRAPARVSALQGLPTKAPTKRPTKVSTKVPRKVSTQVVGVRVSCFHLLCSSTTNRPLCDSFLTLSRVLRPPGLEGPVRL